jgi:hypothetical protein
MLRHDDAVALANHRLIAGSSGRSFAEQPKPAGHEEEHENHAEYDSAPKESATQRGRFVFVEFHDNLVTGEAFGEGRGILLRPGPEVQTPSGLKLSGFGSLEREPKGLRRCRSGGVDAVATGRWVAQYGEITTTRGAGMTPIVVTPWGVELCRPSETVLELLPKS